MASPRLALAGLRRHPVLLCGQAYPGIVSRLEIFFDIEVESDPLDRAMLKSRLRDKAGLITGSSGGVDAELLAGLPYLRAVCKMDANHDDIDLDACTCSGVMATNTPDLGVGDEACRQMAMIAVENLIAAFGFGRIGGHPQNLLNTELRCMLGCCI